MSSNSSTEVMNNNSKDYWEHRFSGDWLEYDGDKQTAFFADRLCEHMPEHIVLDIMSHDYTICDMGCAMGDAIPIYSRRFGINVDGMDFSEKAVQEAAKKNEHSTFWVGDLFSLDNSHEYDVLICSNVMEHFYTPWLMFHNLTSIARHYIIIMVPYREKLQIDEHFYHFSEDVIPVEQDGFRLVYATTYDGSDYTPTYYPGEQILLIYQKDVQGKIMLSSLAYGTRLAGKRETAQVTEDAGKQVSQLTAEHAQEVAELQDEYTNEVAELRAEHTKEVARLQELQSEELAGLRKEIEDSQQRERSLQTDLQSKTEEYNRAYAERENVFLTREAFLSEKITAAKNVCYQINAKTSYKIICTISRFFKQFIFGSLKEKKKFLKICQRSITGQGSEFTGNDGYNFVLNIANLLADTHSVNPETTVAVSNSDTDHSADLQPLTKGILSGTYQKMDVIILSVIDYTFRFQRPQQVAYRFADQGHRVFYINANFSRQYSVEEIRNNLFSVKLKSDSFDAVYYTESSDKANGELFSQIHELADTYAIRDACVIIDYPFWYGIAERLHITYGFPLVIDYMDDFTGFLSTTTDALKETCIAMLNGADLVVASSEFLFNIAKQYNQKVSLIRNGTDVAHFYKAYGQETSGKKRKTVGYYGAISHWFDWETVCYCADHLPECDFILVGDVTMYRDEFEKRKNIKLLGEKAYDTLPEYLSAFDVCLIPFDTSTDLIKATNPVKFYEYLSAGKKIVSTEIPELEPYRDQYVYMSNEKQQFLKYVELCLNEEDTLASPDEAVAFAKENDWGKRYESFSDACKTAFPCVSIVVLTYNNLELNKYCIESILSKTAYPNYELIVFDNHSEDGTREYLGTIAETPGVKVILSEENLGFAGGNNKAIEEAKGEYIVLLNNDTVVTRGWLTALVRHMEEDAECGMCGAVTNSIGNEAMIAVRYHNLRELEEFAYKYTTEHNGKVFNEMSSLAMFCTMIRRDVLNRYGCLDANYAVGMFEDDDYARVVENAGLHFYAAEDCFVHHVNNASFKKLSSEEYRKIFEKNREYYENKWSTKWVSHRYRSGVGVSTNEGMMVIPVSE